MSAEINAIHPHPAAAGEDNFRIHISHEETAKGWRSKISVEFTGNAEAMGYDEVKRRMTVLSILAANRQGEERAFLNYRDAYDEDLKFPEDRLAIA